MRRPGRPPRPGSSTWPSRGSSTAARPPTESGSPAGAVRRPRPASPDAGRRTGRCRIPVLGLAAAGPPDRPDRRGRPPVPARGSADVFLVVDGWGTLRQEFDTLEAAITKLAGRGLAYGIHVIIAANRWPEIRPALKELLATRIELRIGEPSPPKSASSRRPSPTPS
ncbi:MAG TPA: hypothetical protein VGM14_02890 [Streptosporangiaceae bacterium]